LRFIALPLRRTVTNPNDRRFARLDLGLFTKSSIRMNYYEFIRFVAAPVLILKTGLISKDVPVTLEANLLARPFGSNRCILLDIWLAALYNTRTV
jgi:hypothetical protein